MADSNTIINVCLPWVQKSYIHPVTGKELDIGTKEYNELAKTCDELINFDLLDLHRSQNDPTVHTIRSSPMVSFITVAYVCERMGHRIKHPYRKAYSPITKKGDPLLDNFDFGFVWDPQYITKKGITLIPPKNGIKIDQQQQQMFLITIISRNEISVNMLFYHHSTNTWERVAPFGTHAHNDELDLALQQYIERNTDGSYRYYSPIACPIPSIDGDVVSIPKRKLVCALWDLWFIMYRLRKGNAHKERETQYEPAIAAVLTDAPMYHAFLSDYLTYVGKHKATILAKGNSLLTCTDITSHQIDDFLASEIFDLLP